MTQADAAPSTSTLPPGPKTVAPCTPKTCERLGNPCGEYPDGCGGKLHCSQCRADQTCGALAPSQCGTGTCTPTTCDKAGATCGDIADGCGHVLSCGTCKPGHACENNVCDCTAITCAQAGANCGNLANGCGKTLDCGTCDPGMTCTQNVCTCTPTTCAQAGATCGNIADGCGKTLDCGSCPGGKPCNNNSCCGSNETCGNGVDDNCDGQVDEGCTHPCEPDEGNGCNDDDGHGDRCAPSDNQNGCSDARFWAWCNRRNDAYPDIWDNYLRDWVASHCNGTTSFVENYSGSYPAFVCTDSNGVFWSCTTPLVLAFDPLVPVAFQTASHAFDLSAGSAKAVPVEWPSVATPWLAIDRDGNGSIDNGTELFGTSSPRSGDRAARNGFEALAQLDANRDGFVDSSDPDWSRLLVWADANGDGFSQREELRPAAEAGLLGISLTWSIATRCDGRGNCERERAEFRWADRDGNVRAGAVVDVYLRLR